MRGKGRACMLEKQQPGARGGEERVVAISGRAIGVHAEVLASIGKGKRLF